MRILGITVPNEKRLEIGLTCVYGIGISILSFHKENAATSLSWLLGTAFLLDVVRISSS